MIRRSAGLWKKSLKKGRTRYSELQDRNLILNRETVFSIREEYKTLRTNVMFSIPSGGCKVIGVSSAMPLEGKSINCLNMAVAFAQMNGRVLLMDCDLRLPSQARLAALDASPGVSNVLAGLSQLDNSIRRAEELDIDMLLSGDIPPDPAELLGSEQMGKLIEELKSRYDYIFVDLPPINLVADVLVMSRYLSGLVIVIRSAVSTRDSVRKAVGKLETAKTRIIGLIITSVRSRTTLADRYRKYRFAKKNKESVQQDD